MLTTGLFFFPKHSNCWEGDVILPLLLEIIVLELIIVFLLTGYSMSSPLHTTGTVLLYEAKT